jgi:hypothetical protein
MMNGTPSEIRILEIRVDGRKVSSVSPFSLMPERTGFITFYPFSTHEAKLEVFTDIKSQGLRTWSCLLEGGMKPCHYRVFFTEGGLNCHVCEDRPDVF